MSGIIRAFPRRTKASPIDERAYFQPPDMFADQYEPEAIHVSVTFTYDLPRAERLAKQWERIAPVKIGGPATGQRSGEFVPGLYLRHGYTITSRGCPNKCWFCAVPKREGPIRELPIRDGWNVLDDNLLACSEAHIRAVFAMLSRQNRRAEFTGGLEAARFQDWHVDLLAGLKPRPVVFFAYDTPDDEEPLRIAAAKMHAAGFTEAAHRLRAYVLIGWNADTFEAAESRLRLVRSLGITPMAMLWRSPSGIVADNWRAFQRTWARPAIIHAKDCRSAFPL